MRAFRIFTIESGKVSQGVLVEKLTLKGAGINIPAILIGEEGRGRERGVMPVGLTSAQQQEWETKGRVTVQFAESGLTKTGKPKLFARDRADSNEKIIIVFRTGMGYRGGNSHTGDRNGLYKVGTSSYYESWYKEGLTYDGALLHCQEHVVSSDHIHPDGYLPFPGEILVKGTIAEGIAGRMGSGQQLVALMPKDTVFRTGYSGRLYGGPGAHYYIFDGERLLAATWTERSAADLF